MTIKFIQNLVGIALLVMSVPYAHAADEQSLWQLRCVNSEKCMLTQKVTAKRGNQSLVVAGATISKNAANMILTIRVSAAAEQQQGLGLKVDQQDAIRVPLQQCDKQVCESNIKMDNQLVQEMQNGKVLTVAFIDTNKKQFSFPLYLHGFKSLLEKI